MYLEIAKIFCQTNNKPSANICKNDGDEGGRGSGGPKFVYPEMAVDRARRRRSAYWTIISNYQLDFVFPEMANSCYRK